MAPKHSSRNYSTQVSCSPLPLPNWNISAHKNWDCKIQSYYVVFLLSLSVSFSWVLIHEVSPNLVSKCQQSCIEHEEYILASRWKDLGSYDKLPWCRWDQWGPGSSGSHTLTAHLGWSETVFTPSVYNPIIFWLHNEMITKTQLMVHSC